jgi:hypothetical protein
MANQDAWMTVIFALSPMPSPALEIQFAIIRVALELPPHPRHSRTNGSLSVPVGLLRPGENGSSDPCPSHTRVAKLLLGARIPRGTRHFPDEFESERRIRRRTRAVPE